MNQLSFFLYRAVESLRSSNLDSAEIFLKQALKCNKRDPHALRLMGVIYAQKRQYEHAMDYFLASLREMPRNAITKSNLGSVFFELGQYQDALNAYDEAIRIEPKFDEAWLNKGNIFYEYKNINEALIHYDHALTLNPNYAEAWSNRGNALRMLGRFDDAIDSYKHSLSLKPLDHITLNNLGFCLNELMCFKEALDFYDKSIAISPNYHEARLNKSLSLLLQGKLIDGWPLYESRLSLLMHKRSEMSVAKHNWLGIEPLNGKTILLYGEQGFGDFIQFCRYTKLVADLGAKVILEVPESLFSLMSGLEGVSQIIVKGEDLPSFEFQCPLLSLPLFFNTNIDNIPSEERYLFSNVHTVAEWSGRLGLKTKPRIGLVWAGNPDHKNDHNRSIPLKELLNSLPEGYEFISLQKDISENDQVILGANQKISTYDKYLHSYSDTAALIECLDVVISVDTSVAHLSGALGKKTLVLLPYLPDWRWLLNRSDSPWYPSLKLYRQNKRGDWSHVLEKVVADLILLQ